MCNPRAALHTYISIWRWIDKLVFCNEDLFWNSGQLTSTFDVVSIRSLQLFVSRGVSNLISSPNGVQDILLILLEGMVPHSGMFVGCCFFRRSAYVTWTNFNSFSLIFQSLVHLLNLFSECWTFSTATDCESFTAITVASSVNASSDISMLAIHNKYRRGPRTLPCGTPACMGWRLSLLLHESL